jgi:coenzyme F420-reducing hydrogenase beta subunit
MKVYAAKNKNDNIRFNSSSGGVFTAFAEAIIEDGGIVIGASWDGLDVKHIAVDNIDDLAKLRGSKYVQSEVDYSLLDTDKTVLFSGTPCQMPKNKDNYYLIDIICHGTPTKESFKEYCDKNGITKITFRDKTNGWCNYNVTTNKGTEPYIQNEFMQDFIYNKNLCNKCYNCPFKNFKSNSDIQIGDFWGVSNEYSDFADNKGISAVFVKTDKGEKLFNKIKDKIDYIEIEKEKVIKYNPSLIESGERKCQ